MNTLAWHQQMEKSTGKTFPVKHEKHPRETLLSPATAAFVKAQLR